MVWIQGPAIEQQQGEWIELVSTLVTPEATSAP